MGGVGSCDVVSGASTIARSGGACGGRPEAQGEALRLAGSVVGIPGARNAWGLREWA